MLPGPRAGGPTGAGAADDAELLAELAELEAQDTGNGAGTGAGGGGGDGAHLAGITEEDVQAMIALMDADGGRAPASREALVAQQAAAERRIRRRAELARVRGRMRGRPRERPRGPGTAPADYCYAPVKARGWPETDGAKCGGGDFQRFGLPSEAVNRVLRFLAPEELSRVACTSRVMRALADCPTLWKPLVMLHFRARVRTGRLRSFLPKGVDNPAVPWKQVYSACRRRWNARVASIRKRRQEAQQRATVRHHRQLASRHFLLWFLPTKLFVNLDDSVVNWVAAATQVAFGSALAAVAVLMPRQRRVVAAYSKALARVVGKVAVMGIPTAIYFPAGLVCMFPSLVHGVEDWNAPAPVRRVLGAFRWRVVSGLTALVAVCTVAALDRQLGLPVKTGVQLAARLLRIRTVQLWHGIKTVVPMVLPLTRFPLYAAVLAAPWPQRANTRPKRTVVGVLKAVFLAGVERLLWKAGCAGPMKLVAITLARLLFPVSAVVSAVQALHQQTHVPTWQRVAWGCASGAIAMSAIAFEVWLRRAGHWVPRKGLSARQELASFTHMLRVVLWGAGTVTVPWFLHQVFSVIPSPFPRLHGVEPASGLAAFASCACLGITFLEFLTHGSATFGYAATVGLPGAAKRWIMAH